MRSVLLEGPGKLIARVAPMPEPGPGEALVRVHYCGICGSDTHSYSGKHPFVRYPVTPGHEFSGDVVSAGPGVDGATVGRKVAVEPSFTCGECPQCRSGRYNICEDLKVMGFQAPGAMCDAVAVPCEKLHFLPDAMDYRTGALVEPAAVGVHAFERGGASPGDTVAVIGAGAIGLMVVSAARSRGCRVLAVESTEERLRRAVRFGADDALLFPHALEEAGRSGSAPSVVFECVGKPETAELAVRLAPRGSTVVVAGVFTGLTPLPLELVQDGEIDVKGTLMYTGDDFERAIELLGGGTVDNAGFVTGTVPLEDVERGYREAAGADAGTLKVMVEILGG